MKKMFALLAAMLLAPVMLSAQETKAENPFKFSGYFWSDMGFMTTDNDDTTLAPNREKSYQAGRFVFAMDYEKEMNGFYGKARAEVAVNSNVDSASTDTENLGCIPLDSYVEFGMKNLWDVRFGRFQGIEVYSKGEGLEQYTDERKGAFFGYNGTPVIYELDATRGHFDRNGQAALHVKPLGAMGNAEMLNIEVASVFGISGANSDNMYGVRPVVDFKWEFIQLTGGMEYYTIKNLREVDEDLEKSLMGYGGSLKVNSFVVPGADFLAVSAGVSYATSTYEQNLSLRNGGGLDRENSYEIYSYGGFLNLELFKMVSFGGGYHYTYKESDNKGKKLGHTQPYGFVKYYTPIDGLSVKFVYGIMTGDVEETTLSKQENETTSYRVRVEYKF